MMRDDIVTDRLVLRLLSPDALAATEAGRIDEAARLLDLALPRDDWDEVASVARRRLKQLPDCPQYLPWSIRAIALRGTRKAVGYVNFHDLPQWHEMAQRDACAELGYEIFADHRRQGYAEETVRALMAWARERGARHFIFSVAPDNAASQGLARKLGARKIGLQIDEEDGPEDVLLLE
ncbi:GNAT family N-acetyltransferase [Taklimakanibacter deserti]|uniref:GNAT family N-acetyltransferase n=1 Tax=Taklimakanibacter deserti TaxID=2267839 RepID=UPI000E6540F3